MKVSNKSSHSDVYYAMGLHMHQPPGNLELLIEHNNWEAQQIIKCYERAVRYAERYPDAYFHVDFSGILLEQFKDKKIIDRYKDYVDIPDMIERYKRANNIELIGMGYFHPIFPLIPKEDWKEQLQMGRDIMIEMFGRPPKGFWPSEMAFCMEMVPFIKDAGYEYVIVDHVHIVPENKNNLDCFKPYIAQFDNKRITVIPRNRDISNAQESGLNPSWFLEELSKKLESCPCPCSVKERLITTWSDGENGGWFRQMDDNAGFFGYFWSPLIEIINNKETYLKTIKISDFIKRNNAKENATVKTGAWNVASTSGYDFSQWNGSESQKNAINELFKVNERYWKLVSDKSFKKEKLEKVRRLILDAETSCYLFWGESWLPKIYEKLNAAWQLMN